MGESNTITFMHIKPSLTHHDNPSDLCNELKEKGGAIILEIDGKRYSFDHQPNVSSLHRLAPLSSTGVPGSSQLVPQTGNWQQFGNRCEAFANFYLKNKNDYFEKRAHQIEGAGLTALGAIVTATGFTLLGMDAGIVGAVTSSALGAVSACVAVPILIIGAGIALATYGIYHYFN